MSKSLKKFSEQELIQQFNDYLDESYPEVSVGGHSFLPSRVLKDVDPIAYRTGLADYADLLTKVGYEVEGYTS
jgi:hypothetical protein